MTASGRVQVLRGHRRGPWTLQGQGVYATGYSTVSDCQLTPDKELNMSDRPAARVKPGRYQANRADLVELVEIRMREEKFR